MLMRAAVRTAMLQSLLDLLNTHLGSEAKLQAWSGTLPSSCSAADDGVLIAELPCSSTVFGALASDISTANAITDDTDCDAGSVSYWRMKNGTSENTVLQWQEGDDFFTDDIAFGDGDTCTITELTILFGLEPLDS